MRQAHQAQFQPPLECGARVVLVALVPVKGDKDRPWVERVRQAVEACGAQVMAISWCSVVRWSRARKPGGAQRLQIPLSAATVFGRGKVEEIAEIVKQTNEAVVVCNTLTPTQQANLQQMWSVPVLTDTNL